MFRSQLLGNECACKNPQHPLISNKKLRPSYVNLHINVQTHNGFEPQHVSECCRDLQKCLLLCYLSGADKPLQEVGREDFSFKHVTFNIQMGPF